MEMHQIRYFLAVCKTLNFTRAAEECNVAQPSLTRAIKKLEAELGGELFLRERSRTHVSELGRAMMPLLTKSYESALAAKQQAEQHKKAEIAHLRLGLSHSIDAQIVVPALAEVSRAVPDLDIHLLRGTSREIEKYLEDGHIDVAVTANSQPDWSRIDHWQLFSEKLMVAMSHKHPLAKHSSIKLAQVADERLLMRRNWEQADNFSSLLSQQNLSADRCHEISTEADQDVLLMNCFGIGMVPQSVEHSNGNIIKRPLDDIDLHRSLSLLAVSGRKYSQPTMLMINLLRSSDWSRYEQPINS